jgi:hypothetical protein
MNIVIIPCWRRDDFLQVTLDYILKADSADQYLYVFCLDRGFNSGVLEVANAFPLRKLIRRTPQHRFYGNTYNLLEGYKFGCQLARQHRSELIYLIEEDIWIGKDFFTFHEQVQQKFPSFVLSGVKNQNDKREMTNDPSAVYYHPNYQSLGVSWKIANLLKVIPHACTQYYAAMLPYVKRLNPSSSLGSSWAEQDGLINRLAELNDLKCMFPHLGRAFHAGFVGYNRAGLPLEGNREARVAKLREMSQEDMNNRAIRYKDIIFCPLHGNDVKEFTIKEPL